MDIKRYKVVLGQACQFIINAHISRDEKDHLERQDGVTVRVHNKRFGQYIHLYVTKCGSRFQCFFSGNYLGTPHSVFKMMLIVKSKIRKWTRTIYEKVIAKNTFLVMKIKILELPQ